MDPNEYDNQEPSIDDEGAFNTGDPWIDGGESDQFDVDWYSDFESEETEIDGQADDNADQDIDVPSVEQITNLLSALNEGATEQTGSHATISEPVASPPLQKSAPDKAANESALQTSASDEQASDKQASGVRALGVKALPKLDDELREAFLDDAGQCVAAIENGILSYESNPKDPDPLRLIGRELHTLKGASASVGLTELAEFLHGIEDSIGTGDSGKGASGELPSAQDLLSQLDQVGKVIDAVRNQDAPTPITEQSPAGQTAPDRTPAASAPVERAAINFDCGDDRGGDEESVRVKSSQLNRLMDMLAELVMLRNRRETELAELNDIYEELVHGVCQVRAAGDRPAEIVDEETSSLPGIANELMATAQRLRECSQPVAEGNAAVSQFIRQFRGELVQLRRTPVSGLFRRLQRVVRDAAKAENKQVQLQLIGEDAGTERSLQQRLYEPLLHIVRNSVCHGIESPDQRQVAGKNTTGTITLQAQSGADLFVIEIRDDGQGLNYDAIRRRGIENGLLKSDSSASDEELAQLIFQPGFSTRQTADQIAGRGVGMDVVAETLKRMRGWIEVNSTPGQGTCIRLSFPLPSVIQHTMVFRSSGQLYALPMQFIQKAGSNHRQLRTIRLDELTVHDSVSPTDDGVPLVLSCHQSGQEQSGEKNRRVALLVDEIVGPEEVVVRPLPSLLKQHPICCGATLSGLGETVLVLDTMRVMESAARRIAVRPKQTSPPPAGDSNPTPLPKVLVVDDSKSARARVVRSLRRYNVETVEACDGQEAIELMTTQHFSAVFSDMEMPNVNGMELLATIDPTSSEQKTPVVIISSRDEASFRDTAADLGAAGYLIKPLADTDLDRTIASIGKLRISKKDCTPEPLPAGDKS
tara:strand:+ start:21173 stop:23791 length:2619 start_codon:yes stop_codon:yes gene_type:complete